MAAATAVLAASPVRAQVVKGWVRDAETQALLPGATVAVQERGQGTSADVDGRYHLTLPGAGTYVLIVRHVGYEPVAYPISVGARSRATVNAELQAVVIEAAEVDVVGVRNELLADRRSVAVLGVAELEAVRGQTLGETLDRLPGVTALRTGPSIAKPVIRGLHSSRVVVIDGGVRQEGQQWGAEHAPAIDPFSAGEIQVVKGAAGVEYGAGAIGGVVDVEPLPLRTASGVGGEVALQGVSNSWQGAGSLRLDGSTGTESGTGWSWRARGSLRRAGDARTPTGVIDNSAFAERSLALTLGHRTDRSRVDLHLSRFDTDLGIYTGAHLSTPDAFAAAVRQRRPADAGRFSYRIDAPKQAVTHDVARLRGQVELATGDHIEAQYALQRNHRQEFDAHCRFCTDPGAEPAFDLTLLTHTADLTLRTRPLGASESAFVVAGVHGMNQGNVNGEAGYLIPNFRALTGGTFVRATWLRGDWTWEAGTRVDYRWLRAFPRAADGRGFDRRVTDYLGVSGVVGTIWQVAPAWSLSANLSTGWRPPSVNELYSLGVHHGAAQFEVGAPGLTAERLAGADVTLRHRARRVRGEVSTYLNAASGFISLLPTRETVVTVRGVFPEFAYQQTGARLAGVDGLVEANLTRALTAGVSGAVVRGTDTTHDLPLFGMPSDRVTAYGVLRLPAYERLRNGDVRLELTTVRRQTRMPPGVDVAPAPDGYTVVGLSAGAEVMAGGVPVRWRLSADNLFNTRYRDVLSRYRYFVDEPGRTIILRVTVPFGHSDADG